VVPAAILKRWPAADLDDLLDRGGLARLPIDQTVGPGWCRGGADAARATLTGFLSRVGTYREDTRDATKSTSGLAPYLHFGHLSAHHAVRALLTQEEWDPGTWGERPTASRDGWWHLRPDVETVLDQLLTWRELGYAWCHHRPDHESWSALPAWARTALELRSADPRPVLYTPAQLEAATTHDPLWNAAQRQLVREGRIHTYLRMLWGKKILEWNPTPKEALALCFHLNNKYALDGRNPNSATGITWVFGAHDRPWAPQRPIFGSIRYMSSASAMTKVDGKGYLALYGEKSATQLTIF
jgi:deoxyribodipyrimidine photo-lyase